MRRWMTWPLAPALVLAVALPALAQRPAPPSSPSTAGSTVPRSSSTGGSTAGVTLGSPAGLRPAPPAARLGGAGGAMTSGGPGIATGTGLSSGTARSSESAVPATPPSANRGTGSATTGAAGGVGGR